MYDLNIKTIWNSFSTERALKIADEYTKDNSHLAKIQCLQDQLKSTMTDEQLELFEALDEEQTAMESDFDKILYKTAIQDVMSVFKFFLSDIKE